MTLELYANDPATTGLAWATLSAGYIAGATSVHVTANAPYPAADPTTTPATVFRVRFRPPAVAGVEQALDPEILLVTDNRTTTWTVVGAQEGSTAANHASGCTVEVLLTRAALLAQLTVAEAYTDTQVGTKQPLDADLTAIAALDSSTAGGIWSDGAGWVKKTASQIKTALALVKGDVGLGNVDNTADTAKPVSTAQKTYIDAGDAATLTSAEAYTDAHTPPDATATVKGVLQLAGDLGGTAAAPTVPGLAGKQAHDTDLDAIAALDSSTAGAIASDGAGWIKKTYAQLKTALSITTSDVSGLGTAATHAATDFDTTGAAAAVQALAALKANNLSDLANAGTARTNLGLGTAATHAATDFATSLTRTAVKTTNYTAVAGDLVPCDTTSGAFTVTLPNAPAVGTRVAVKHIIQGGSNAVTVACAGSDVFNKTSGPTTGTLTLVNQALAVQYDTGGIWTVVSDDLPLSSLMTSLNGTYTPLTRQVISGTGLTGGGDLTADRTLAVSYGTASGTAAQGNDSRFTVIGAGVYGDGSDGTVTFDGTTTILGLAPSSSVYTLSRDLFLAAGTINSGVAINTNGYRIFCAGTLTNNGTIRHDGPAASGTNGATGGAALTNSSSTISAQTTAGNGLSTAGANGGTAAGATGQNNGGNNLTYGARGGTGGNGASNNGGAGGTVGSPPSQAGWQPIRTLPHAAVGLTIRASTGAWGQVTAGTGGGAGAGDGTNNGGGGGAGGGICIVLAQKLAGTGAIRARGGAGGTVTTSTLGAGGGGGGGGGFVVVVSSSVSAGAIAGQTIDANGGAAGTGLGTTFTAATAGTNGLVVLLPN